MCNPKYYGIKFFWKRKNCDINHKKLVLPLEYYNRLLQNTGAFKISPPPVKSKNIKTSFDILAINLISANPADHQPMNIYTLQLHHPHQPVQCQCSFHIRKNFGGVGFSPTSYRSNASSLLSRNYIAVCSLINVQNRQLIT